MVKDGEFGGIRWIVASGPADEVFGQLGELARDEIGVIASDDEATRLRRHADAHPELLTAVTQASAAACPQAWAELAAMADGAGQPAETLALLNCRGDLAAVASGGAGENCSDLAWHGTRSFIAHNEDEPVSYLGKCALLTLHLDGQQPVTAYWVPGFLPANAFSIAGEPGAVVVISVDHLTVSVPARAPGRAFVARELQRRATSVATAIEFLETHPSAGGFSYTIGDRTGRVVIAEAAAGKCALAEVSDLAWHTNHGRLNDAADSSTRGTSVKRGEILDALEPPEEPDHDWFLDALATVRANPAGAMIAATLCTFVAELTTAQIVICDRDASPQHLSFVDFLTGPPLT